MFPPFSNYLDEFFICLTPSAFKTKKDKLCFCQTFCFVILFYFHSIQWFYEPHFIDETAKPQNNDVESCPK